MPAFAPIAALLLTPLGTPAGGFHWQRIITPPPGAATEQACVVLDAATFANAAPALRDLRLFQDGNELAYVIEESYDERALNSGVTSDDDRSEYEPVLALPLQAQASGTGGWTGEGTGIVPAHVPVERLRLDPAPNAADQIHLVAAIPGTHPALAEVAETTLTAGHATWALTLGANLQHAMTVKVEAHGSAAVQRVVLEMRRRSLCYQPRSASPLVLYLGGGQGISAKTYGLANGFSVSANRPYASMGPLEPNPDQQAPNKPHLSRLLIAIAVLGLTLLLTLWIGLELLRKDKDRQKAVPSA